MHPREGWTEDTRPGGLSRRGFLRQGAAAGLLAAGAGSLLPGCSSGTTTASSGAHAAGGIPLPRPDNPVIPVGLKLPVDALTAGSYRIELQAMDSAGHSTSPRSADFEIE